MSVLNSVAFIHAKGTSERVGGKNMQLINGQSLVEICVKKAKEAGCFDAIILDSDCKEIMNVGESLGIDVMDRDSDLRTNKANGNDILIGSIKNFKTFCSRDCTTNRSITTATTMTEQSNSR